jgi:acyl carrier protein
VVGVRENTALDRDEFVARFDEFITGIDRERSLSGVGLNDNLFDAGVLDSLTVARVIVFLERLVGKPVDLELASIDSFATLTSIYDNFVAG